MADLSGFNADENRLAPGERHCITLYKCDAAGDLQSWEIRSSDFEIEIEWGAYGGVSQQYIEYVDWGLAGRTREEQLDSRIQSRINKKTDAGYVYDAGVARSQPATNAMGLKKPMLALPISKCKDVTWDGSYLQYKYNGHRCLIHRKDNELIAYSRNGKVINSIPHILTPALLARMHNKLTIDGELYLHGTALQKISSYVTKLQDQSLALTYVCYDAMIPGEYKTRLNFIRTAFHNTANFKIAPTFLNPKPEKIKIELELTIIKGYEGLMLRQPGFEYADGKRSKALLKIKQWLDDEFVVIAIKPSVDGWAILTCRMQSGVTFEVTAPGTHRQKEKALENRDDYIGRMVTVQYANLTEAGKPFNPVATGWRDKAAE